MGRVLVACEYSGRVREAFAAQGHDAWSCDMLPTEQPGQHYQGDVRDMLAQEWDLMVCHPPCTYLTSAGARWWPGRQAEQAEALDFVRLLLGANIPRIALENPAGRIGTQVRKADQYVHPWQFGHMETKTTGLWLVGLPHLTPTKVVREEMDKLPAHQKHRVHYMSPGPDRWKERSRTFEGIALAMAEQWGHLLPFNAELCGGTSATNAVLNGKT